MNDEHMLMYALVFVLGFMVARMMSGRLVEGWTEVGTRSSGWEKENHWLTDAKVKEWLQYLAKENIPCKSGQTLHIQRGGLQFGCTDRTPEAILNDTTIWPPQRRLRDQEAVIVLSPEDVPAISSI